MAGWVGPALVAAVIAALVSVMGWFVTAGLTLRAEQRRREEKTRDFMIALRAEIRSELASLQAFNGDVDLQEVERHISNGTGQDILVPKLVRHLVLDAMVPELFILPENVIDPLVLYLRQREAVSNLSDDLRSMTPNVRMGPQGFSMYRDLVILRRSLMDTANDTLHALEKTGSA